jgi:hypothetical protein
MISQLSQIGIHCDTNDNMCTCKKYDCSDFPSFEVEVIGNSGSFTLSIDYHQMLFNHGHGRYHLHVHGRHGHMMGNKRQWTFGQDLFHKYYTIFDRRHMRLGYIE